MVNLLIACQIWFKITHFLLVNETQMQGLYSDCPAMTAKAVSPRQPYNFAI